MKLIFSIIAIFAITFSNLFASNLDGDLLRDPKIKVEFMGEIGVPRKQCRGIGTGCLKGITILVEIDFNNEKVANANTVIFSKENDKFISLVFTSNDKNPGLDFEVDADFKLDPKIAEAFRRKSITILKGNYKATETVNGQYTVTVPIIVK